MVERSEETLACSATASLSFLGGVVGTGAGECRSGTGEGLEPGQGLGCALAGGVVPRWRLSGPDRVVFSWFGVGNSRETVQVDLEWSEYATVRASRLSAVRGA